MSQPFKGSKPWGIKAVEEMFGEEGAVFRLVRMNKHAIYELDTPFGPRRLVCSLTTSDWRAAAKQRSQVRRLLKTGSLT